MSISAMWRRRPWHAGDRPGVEGRKLRFKLECRDEKEIIGRDFDERAVIDPARFLAPPEKKAAG